MATVLLADHVYLLYSSGFAQANRFVADIVNTIPFSQENVAKDSSRTAWGIIRAHQSAHTCTPEFEHVIVGPDGKAVSGKSEDYIGEGLPLGTIYRVLSAGSPFGPNLFISMHISAPLPEGRNEGRR